MRVHDWTKVSIDEFHDFHQCWTAMLSMQLNQGVLPASHYSQVRRLDFGSDEVILEDCHRRKNRVLVFESHTYGSPLQREIATVELVCPGDKAAPGPLSVFVDRIVAGILSGVHFLVIDLFPPTRWGSPNIHDAIWSALTGAEERTSTLSPLLQMSYVSSESTCAYVEPIRIGGGLASMPLFLASEAYVAAPLNESYADAFSGSPKHIRRKLEESLPPN